jgi:hypothetical protein
MLEEAVHYVRFLQQQIKVTQVDTLLFSSIAMRIGLLASVSQYYLCS